MEIFAPFFLCVVFLAAMYGLMRLALHLNRLFAKRSVYKSGIYTASTVHTLLLAQFSEKKLLSDKYLPRRSAYEVVFENCDHILFLNGAVAIVTVCREEGKINNLAFGETWYTRVHTRAGGERELIFENPITAGERKIQALAKILENAKLRIKIPIEHIVIFPSRHVRFTLPRQEEIMSPPEALRKLTEMNQKVRFTEEEKKAIQKAVKQSSLSQSQVEKLQAKKQKAELQKAQRSQPKKPPVSTKKTATAASAPTYKKPKTAKQAQKKPQTMQNRAISAPKSTPAVRNTAKHPNQRTPQTKVSPQTAQTPMRRTPDPYRPQNTKQSITPATKNTNRRHR